MTTPDDLRGHALMQSLIEAQERAAAKQTPQIGDREAARLRRIEAAARIAVQVRGLEGEAEALEELQAALYPEEVA